jgi:RNA 2',3'-cyclic 3'-phosphodiesterase
LTHLRLFLGVEIDESARAAAAAVAERLRQRLQRAAPQLHARWVSPEHLHITVWFLGEVNEERARAIEDVLRLPFATPAFDLEIGGAGRFPSSGQPRIFWLGIRQGGAELEQLYREVGQRLVPLGFEPERRSFSAHLTLARVKDVEGAPSRALADVVATVPAGCGATRVSALTLFRSRLSPRGAAYEALLRVPLRT